MHVLSKMTELVGCRLRGGGVYTYGWSMMCTHREPAQHCNYLLTKNNFFFKGRTWKKVASNVATPVQVTISIFLSVPDSELTTSSFGRGIFWNKVMNKPQFPEPGIWGSSSYQFSLSLGFIICQTGMTTVLTCLMRRLQGTRILPFRAKAATTYCLLSYGKHI